MRKITIILRGPEGDPLWILWQGFLFLGLMFLKMQEVGDPKVMEMVPTL